MKCSLVITTYNRPEALDLVLRSAFVQAEPPCEIIVADDGSTAETAMLVDRCRDASSVPVLHVWQEDLGFRASASRNMAIAAATGDYVVIVDGDMLLHRDFMTDHRLLAQEGSFIQGSRVLLSPEITRQMLLAKNLQVPFCEHGLGNRKNALRLPLLSRLLARKCSSLRGIRSCNMSFFRNDCIRVNGFNEDFVGWGREDSEFAVRMINSGVLRRNVRFSAIAFHLWHEENPRSSLPENDRRLFEAMSGRVTFCRNGIGQHLSISAS
ncbi:MAG: glycosyltransferase [Chlorobiaceae bacterium]|nr:glycosyltransferase [Chlorobiaceae bacterium]